MTDILIVLQGGYNEWKTLATSPQMIEHTWNLAPGNKNCASDKLGLNPFRVMPWHHRIHHLFY